MTTKKRVELDLSSTKAFMEDLLTLNFFEEIQATLEPGASKSKLVLITGENATGKSFVRRVISSFLRQEKIEFISLSMQGRTESGVIKSFIYGDESNSSTGDLSGHVIAMAIKTSLSRDAENRRHAIAWDEPDVGLSDNYAAGAADEILEFMTKPPKSLAFAVLTTHRKSMLERFVAARPHHLRLGDTKTLEQMLAEPIVPKRLDELNERSLQTYRRLRDAFKL